MGGLRLVCLIVIGHFEPLLLNKFFDPSTPSMRKGRDGEMEEKKMEKIMVKIVATTSLPVDRLTATHCNAAARAKNK